MFQQSLMPTIDLYSDLYSISSSIYFFFFIVLHFLPFSIFMCLYIVNFIYFVLTVPLSLNSRFFSHTALFLSPYS